jgi:hypothetical protein
MGWTIVSKLLIVIDGLLVGYFRTTTLPEVVDPSSPFLPVNPQTGKLPTTIRISDE